MSRLKSFKLLHVDNGTEISWIVAAHGHRLNLKTIQASVTVVYFHFGVGV